MALIAKLSDKIINQIAAGEVVERPVAVVKELVENALDAGATRIEIVFEKGGKSLIRITDNGTGMDRTDAELSVERHATSKLKHVDDILKISSFGFRGEALPSIASVCRFTLKTRRKEDAEGTEIRINGGRGKQVQSCGMSPGTLIEVSQLFNSVPARRKFLKTDRTEAAHIIQMSRLLAIANPEVAFVLIEDGKEIFNSPICHKLEERVAEIYGRQRARELMPISVNGDRIRLSGLISKTGTSRATRAELITFVNGRPVDSRLLNYALIESYHSYLPRGRYPVSFLFIEIKPDLVDVNVHPSKREVRFRDEGWVRQFLMESLIEKLREETGKSLRDAERVIAIESPATSQVLAPVQPPPITESPGSESSIPRPAIRPEPNLPDQRIAPSSGHEASRRMEKRWKFVGLHGEQFGFFSDGIEVIILDGLRAQKRIRFEKIMAELTTERVPQQDHLIPVLIELEPLEASITQENLSFFKSMGFELESFGGHSFRLRSYPVWFQGDAAQRFLKDMILKISERGLRRNQAEPARALIAKLAVRRIRFPEIEDWDQLLEQLLSCANPLIDAEERKTFVKLSRAELEMKFGR